LWARTWHSQPQATRSGTRDRVLFGDHAELCSQIRFELGIRDEEEVDQFTHEHLRCVMIVTTTNMMTVYPFLAKKKKAPSRWIR
jgi:hypothetical protein